MPTAKFLELFICPWTDFIVVADPLLEILLTRIGYADLRARITASLFVIWTIKNLPERPKPSGVHCLCQLLFPSIRLFPLPYEITGIIRVERSLPVTRDIRCQ